MSVHKVTWSIDAFLVESCSAPIVTTAVAQPFNPSYVCSYTSCLLPCEHLACMQADPSAAGSPAAPAAAAVRKLKADSSSSKDLERCSIPGETVPHVVAKSLESNSSSIVSSTETPPASAAAAAGGVARGQAASLRAQANALYRKNAVYQRRNMCSNVCLLSAPIFFCLMLLAVQVAINRLLLTGEDYEVRGGWVGPGPAPCWAQQQQLGD